MLDSNPLHERKHTLPRIRFSLRTEGPMKAALCILGVLAACTSQSSPTDPSFGREGIQSTTGAMNAGSVATINRILRDPFSRPTLNFDRWTVSLSIPQGSAAVLVRDGKAILRNRGYLTTRDAFTPGPHSILRISGDWIPAGAPDDFLQILTRATGTPDPTNPFGESPDGIEFIAFTEGVFEDPSGMGIGGRGPAAGSVVGLVSSGELTIQPGARYHFEVLDDGNRVQFALVDPIRPGRFRRVTAFTQFVGTANHVVFHNRERCCSGDHEARLDNLIVSSSER